ncbi:unnamed protein product [Spirodela intermedia]|uniref:Vacuolar protein sorting-associated protein 28 homolog n=1 Tax=Spirodela intermedia TaxID=51605 RepID=A0A7I8JR39_SPIIN|nr:unnamed protein product [Spirodela intermedia]CAA6672043.1 unnamed protein product [Spirodela intermedia]
MEVKLWNDKRERDMYENFAELYAIIKTTEKLEKAYVRDLVSSADYETECLKLIAQFKNLSTFLRDVVPSVERFAETYKMDCPAALNRLIVSGVPATVEHRTASMLLRRRGVSPALRSVGISDEVGWGIVPPDFEGRIKVKDWILRLSKMGAADELTEQQSRQLHFDLESSYTAFMAALPNAGS